MTARLALPLLLVLMLSACDRPQAPEAEPPVRTATLAAEAAPLAGPPDQFGDYWYQGVAELTSYDLEQARYGELHDGTAVLIYVTEPFSRTKQVKLDNAQAAGEDAVTVLKLNATRTFNTGIYPYSMMTSVFTPVERQAYPRTLKVTTTSQEWCGHTFTQLNQTSGGYRAEQYSYFESEGDTTVTLPDALLEDELWMTIRLNPADLPTGAVRAVPGTIHQRLAHLDWGVYPATATLAPAGDSLMAYTLAYDDLGRTLTIRYQAAFPYAIEGWEETVRSGFGPNARTLTTTATRRARTQTAYWQQNGTADERLRQELLALED